MSHAESFDGLLIVDEAFLPFVREPAAANEALAAAIEAAFRLGPEPLAVDGLILCLAEALVDAGCEFVAR